MNDSISSEVLTSIWSRYFIIHARWNERKIRLHSITLPNSTENLILTSDSELASLSALGDYGVSMPEHERWGDAADSRGRGGTRIRKQPPPPIPRA